MSPPEVPIGPLISLGLLGLLLWGIGYGGYELSRRSALARRRVIRSGIIAILVIGGGVAWLSTKVPETPGSPGTLVMLSLLWLLGGGAIMVSAATVVGAWIARPSAEIERGIYSDDE